MEPVEIKLTDKKSCVCMGISWVDFQRILKLSRRMRQNEHITHVKVDERGITYYVDTK